MMNDSLQNNFTLFFKIEREKKTGSLYVKKGETLRILYFLKGKFAYAHSNLKGERLLDIISSSGLLSDEYIEDVVNNIVPGESLGKMFVERGYLTPMQLTRIVETQQKKIFFSVILLKDGEFRFFEEDLPTNITPLNFEIPLLIKEGIYQCNDRVLVATLVGNLDAIYEKRESEYERFIGEKEREILNVIENEKTSLYELLQKSSYEEFETLKIILFLKLIKAIDEYQEKETDFSNVFGQEEEENFGEIEAPENISFFSPDESEIEEAFERAERKEDSFEDEIKIEGEKDESTKKEEKIFSSHHNEEEEEEKEFKIKKLLIIVGIILLALIVGAIFYVKNKLSSQTPYQENKIIEVERKRVKPVIDKGFKKEFKINNSSLEAKKEETRNKALGEKSSLIKKKNSSEIPVPIKKDKKPEEKNQNKELKNKTTEKNILENKKIISKQNIPDYRELIRKQRFSLAAQKYKLAVLGINADYSILLEVDCLIDSVKNAYIKASFSKKIFIIPRKVKRKRCYAVFWGLFNSQKEAQREISKLPAFFKFQTPKPKVVRIKAFLTK